MFQENQIVSWLRHIDDREGTAGRGSASIPSVRYLIGLVRALIRQPQELSVGGFYFEGIGREKDVATGMAMVRRAAMHGLVDAAICAKERLDEEQRKRAQEQADAIPQPAALQVQVGLDLSHQTPLPVR